MLSIRLIKLYVSKVKIYYEVLKLYIKAKRFYLFGSYQFYTKLRRNKTMALLDNRTSVLEKIEKYESALKDSYMMIRSYPRNIEGYLRAGKILQLMNKHIKAIYIYKLGIKCLSHDLKKKNLLKKLFFSTLKNIKKNKSLVLQFDIFRKFPMEIILNIFYYLSFKTISLCLRVSRNWRQMILSLDYLFYNLDFSFAKKTVSSKIILLNIKRSHNLVQKIVLNHKCVINDSVITYMSRFCKKLTHLTLTKGFDSNLFLCSFSAFSSLLSLVFLCEIELSFIAQVMSNAPDSLQKIEARKLLVNFIPRWGQKITYIKIIKLIRVDISFCSNKLRIFDISDMLRIIPKATQIFLNNWIEILVLDSYGFSHLDKLDVLDLSGSRLSRIPLMPKCLLNLNLSYLLETDLSFSSLNFECLRCLNLSYSPRLYSDTVITLIGYSGSSLKELFLDYCPLIDRHCIINIVSSCKFIDKLSLSGNSWVDDSLLAIIISELKVLKYIDLSNCLHVSGSSIVELVKTHLSSIIRIRLNGCYNVSLDAVTWIRQLGINIDYSFENNYAIK
ncbi:hypothetical protein PNEG_03606 [Pneumocystis murina B123]|uniref:F-box domain-containing protein n=1 Tax=Pneumocystis murina (strain B123) TaxID=1069680 RepID=M7PAN1_PNEMU|nr:hypothetical protein PNEG_03606 [Pneumocystis murina B123]EMR10915.1 hypothetical protein PNEG_03606 [Pneumocystis murina B123]